MQFLHEVQPGELPKVILLSDSEDEDTEAEACRVLSKPFDHDQLIAKLIE